MAALGTARTGGLSVLGLGVFGYVSVCAPFPCRRGGGPDKGDGFALRLAMLNFARNFYLIPNICVELLGPEICVQMSVRLYSLGAQGGLP